MRLLPIARFKKLEDFAADASRGIEYLYYSLPLAHPCTLCGLGIVPDSTALRSRQTAKR